MHTEKELQKKTATFSMRGGKYVSLSCRSEDIYSGITDATVLYMCPIQECVIGDSVFKIQ